MPAGQELKTRNVDSIFRLAYDVAPYQSGNAIGWERSLSGQVLMSMLEAHASTVRTALATEADFEDLKAKLAELEAGGLSEAKAEMVPQTTVIKVEGAVGDGQPTAADLDKDTEDQPAEGGPTGTD